MNVIEKLTEIAQNEPKVYEAGKRAGRDAFWDAFQVNGQRNDYAHAFRGPYWTDETFSPKYDLKGSSNTWEGYQEAFYKSGITNLKGILEKNNVRLITSDMVVMAGMFHGSKIEHLPEIDASSALKFDLTFYNMANIKDISLRGVRESCTFDRTFVLSSKIENLVLTDSVIGQDLSLGQAPKLSRNSIENVICCLSDTATGKTLTLSKEAVEAAFGSGNIQLSPSFDADFLANKGYTVTDNQDGSVTVSGGTETSVGYISFSPGALPQGTYELSHLETGEGAGVGLDVTIYDANGDSVSNFALHSGNKTSITIEEGYTLSLEIGPYGEYDNKIFKPTLNRLGWESLQDSKPNWTISLV
ncbi:MAG: hypothetical protein E7606_03185 [Ruminococcaceae bacterium]|nr:hypothetical protein [Oscillospiraceae bacterium]